MKFSYEPVPYAGYISLEPRAPVVFTNPANGKSIAIKALFGPTLRARSFPRQATALFIKVAALNRMTHLGMPDSYRLAA